MNRIMSIMMSLLLASICMTGISCKKEKPEVKINYEFTVSKLPLEEIIQGKQSKEIGLKINRGQGYTGKYYIQYSQASGNGLGTLTYNGSILKEGNKQEVSSDQVQLRYSAITENYHQLDFTIYNDLNKAQKVSVVFNADKKGESDNIFEVINETTAKTVYLFGTAAIKFQLNRSKVYQGKYFIRYSQAPNHGMGIVTYNGEELQKEVPYEIVNDAIQLRYTAQTENFHQLDFTIFDESGVRKEFSILLNEDLRGNDDKAFTISNQTIEKTINADQTVPIKIKLTKGKGYQGKYFIEYNQLKNNGIGTVNYFELALEKGIKYEISDENILLNYTATTENYHQLDFTISDDLGKKESLSVILNKDKQGIDDNQFSASISSVQRTILEKEMVSFTIKIKKGLAYQGKYFIKYNQLKNNGFGTLYLGDSILRKLEGYEIHNGEIELFYHALSELYHELDISVYDEQNRKQNFTIVFNEHLKHVSQEGFDVYYDDYKNDYITYLTEFIKFHLVKIDKNYTGKYYIQCVQLNSSGAIYIGSTLASGKHLYWNTKYELKPNAQHEFSMFYQPSVNTYTKVKLIFTDENNFTVEKYLEFNTAMKP